MAINRLQSLLLVVPAALFSLQTNAGESAFRLKDDPLTALVVAKCSICHSVDYIQMNSPFLTRKGWEAEVRKMAKVMGAPIAEDDIPALVDYLTRDYGVQ